MGREWDRREFLTRAGYAGAALAQLPLTLKALGWLDVAQAQEADLTKDTINGLVAFVVPGLDEYSVAQGVTGKRAGGVDSGATDAFIQNLDTFLPAPDLAVPAEFIPPANNDETVPLSGAVAGLLNTMALRVNPAASEGRLPSPFSRLSFADKAEVFNQIETMGREGSDDLSRNLCFVAGIVPGFIGFIVYGESLVFDAGTKELTDRPLGWDLSGYQGNRTTPVEGWDEFIGYYKGHRKATR